MDISGLKKCFVQEITLSKIRVNCRNGTKSYEEDVTSLVDMQYERKTQPLVDPYQYNGFWGGGW